MKKSRLSKYLQRGGQGLPKVIVEKKEYVKNTAGEVYRVSDKMPSHDDTTIVGLKKDKKVKPGKGGVELEDIQQVVSATTENRTKNHKRHTEVDESLKFFKDEAKDFIFNNFGFKGKVKGSLSPAGVIDKTVEAKENFVKKFNETGYREDSIVSGNTLRANQAQLETLPELEEIFDIVFQEQERKRVPEGTSEEMQRGGIKIQSPQDLLDSTLDNTRVHKNLYLHDVEPFPPYQEPLQKVSTPRRKVQAPVETRKFNFDLKAINSKGFQFDSTLQMPDVVNPYEYQQGPYAGYERVINSEYIKNPDGTYGQMQHKYNPGKLVKKKFQVGGPNKSLLYEFNNPTTTKESTNRNSKQDRNRLKGIAEIQNTRIADAPVHTLKETKRQSTLGKGLDITLNPFTAAGYAVRGEDIPDNFTKGDINPIDHSLALATSGVGSLIHGGLSLGRDAANDELGLHSLIDVAGYRGINDINKLNQSIKKGTKKFNELKGPFLKSTAGINEGSKLIDKRIAERIGELNSTEGRRRLTELEERHLRENEFGYGSESSDFRKQVTENIDKLFKDLSTTRNINKEFVSTPRYKRPFLKYNNIDDDNAFAFASSRMRPHESEYGIGVGKNHVNTESIDHEFNHLIQRNYPTYLDDTLVDHYSNYEKTTLDGTRRENSLGYFLNYDEGYSFEPTSYLAETRQNMLKQGFIKDIYEEVTPGKIENFLKNRNTTSYHDRLANFSSHIPENYNILSKVMNQLPTIGVTALGTTAIANQKQQGGFAVVYKPLLNLPDSRKKAVLMPRGVKGKYPVAQYLDGTTDRLSSVDGNVPDEIDSMDDYLRRDSIFVEPGYFGNKNATRFYDSERRRYIGPMQNKNYPNKLAKYLK